MFEPLEDRRLLAAIQGQKFHDIDGNGQHDAGEPGLNGWTIELRDSGGMLVATATTNDQDQDANGEIDPEKESGWYSFENLATGVYLVSEVQQEGWTGTTADPVTSQARQLDEQFNFFFSSEDVFLNWQGRNEKWVRAANDDNNWYFILPDGGLYDWNEETGVTSGTPLEGTLVAQLDPIFYTHPHLLAESSAPGSEIVVISAGDDVRTIDFGNQQRASVEGRKWHDLDANGERDSGEPFLNGWTIELLDSAGATVATMTTADRDLDQNGQIDPETESGWYRFTGLAPGSYQVREVLQAGWVQSAPAAGVVDPNVPTPFQVNLAGTNEVPPVETTTATGSCNASLSADQGSFQIICNHDVVDPIAAHIHRGAADVAGPVIIGFASGQSPLALTWDQTSDPPLTPADVADLFAGNLYVNVHSVEFPGGEIRGQIEGSAPPPTPVSGHAVVLDSSTDVETVDFGNYQRSSISGRKWHDVNMNGQRDADEPFLNGWTIELINDAGEVVATATTSDRDADGDGQIDPETESGWYQFANVEPGSYLIREIPQSGSVPTAPPGSLPKVEVSIENLAPNGGLFLTPFWVGFHDGTFDLYDLGAPASLALERIAEDGDVTNLRGDFAANAAGAAGGIDGVMTSPSGFPDLPVFDPGEASTATFELDPTRNQYFSYASMIIPSNDAFVANGNPQAHQLFDAAGNFTGPVSITVLGMDVRDAGTEENTEMEAAFINQTAPDMGTATPNGVVANHPGFINSLGNPGGTSIILGGTTAAGTTVDPVLGDFTQPDTVIARITVTSLSPAREAGTHTVAVASGQSVSDLDFGNFQSASIHGRKWNDLNGDGARDAGEPFLNGWAIQLIDSTGAVVAEATTMDMDMDANGAIDPETETGWYWFDGVVPGLYVVREVRQDGWIQSAPAPALEHAVVAVAGSPLDDIDFGNRELTVDIVDVSPDPRAGAVDSVGIVFSHPVDGLDVADFGMVRINDTILEVSLASATLTTEDKAIWILGNLTEMTDITGIYQLFLNAQNSAIVTAELGVLLVVGAVEQWINGPGDATLNGDFNQLDIVDVLQEDRFSSGPPAIWGQGDWNGDGMFNQEDLDIAEQVGHYLQGPFGMPASTAGNQQAADAAFAEMGSEPA